MDPNRLNELAINDSGLIFDPATGTISTCNPVGTLIIQSLRQGKTLLEVRDTVLENYDGQSAVVENDILEFCRELKKMGLVGND
ncbi:MAG TPA: PqqD family protein [Bdellovibrionota bacterium]|nr:PqqD family protein [Bdellovibrionota bacterium]